MIESLEINYAHLEAEEMRLITELGIIRVEKRKLSKQIEEYYDTAEELTYWQDRRKE